MIDICAHIRNDFNRKIGESSDDHPLLINSCGYYKFLTKDWITQRGNGRLDYQMIYMHKGRSYHTINNTEYIVEEGNIVLYRPYEPQNYTYFHGDFPEAYWIHFTGNKIQTLLKNLGFEDSAVFHTGLNPNYTRLFDKIIIELRLKQNFHTHMSASYLHELLGLMARKASPSPTTLLDSNPGYKNVINIIHNQYQQKWTLAQLASICNVSTCHFVHTFKKITGVSPLSYLIFVRMDKAKELLSCSSLSVSEIAEIIGYDNPLYFSRLFRKYTNTSPSQFRGYEQD